jgi:hypothetical protein
MNYLCPSVKNGPWTEAEDRLLLAKINEIGRSWSVMGRFFPGRSENDIKNRWYSHLRYATVQDGNHQLVLVKDQGETMFPQRKKRNRTRVCPQQNAMRMLERSPQCWSIPSAMRKELPQPQLDLSTGDEEPEVNDFTDLAICAEEFDLGLFELSEWVYGLPE